MQGPSGTEDDTAIDEDDNMQTLVWGTNIHVPTLCRRIRRFLRHFEERDTGESKYVALLQQVYIPDSQDSNCPISKNLPTFAKFGKI